MSAPEIAWGIQLGEGNFPTLALLGSTGNGIGRGQPSMPTAAHILFQQPEQNGLWIAETR
ncbi:unnamed protein product [Clonostachys solani]|uniref:Uncharacterized protein n=1 Tax=Clonostachys solani TaxID=160281 RepID=A0A9N9W0U6_9HYPO|nr:unnamed protein product [Clonostachys solani]